MAWLGWRKDSFVSRSSFLIFGLMSATIAETNFLFFDLTSPKWMNAIAFSRFANKCYQLIENVSIWLSAISLVIKLVKEGSVDGTCPVAAPRWTGWCTHNTSIPVQALACEEIIRCPINCPVLRLGIAHLRHDSSTNLNFLHFIGDAQQHAHTHKGPMHHHQLTSNHRSYLIATYQNPI